MQMLAAAQLREEFPDKEHDCGGSCQLLLDKGFWFTMRVKCEMQV